jgi:hypothetical protein
LRIGDPEAFRLKICVVVSTEWQIKSSEHGFRASSCRGCGAAMSAFNTGVLVLLRDWGNGVTNND